MLPEFLKKYENTLIEHKREFVRINAKSLNLLSYGKSLFKDPLDKKASKFLGLPFFPKSKDYPKDSFDMPFPLGVQINFAEIPKLENFPTEGILQLFLSNPGDWFAESDGLYEHRIVYHTAKELEQDCLKDFSFIDEEYCECVPIMDIHALSFEKAVEYGCITDSECKFDFQFGNLDVEDFRKTLSQEELPEFDYLFGRMYQHKLGGYAAFDQSDIRKELGGKGDINLLELGSTNGVEWRDGGIGHIFIDKESY